MESIQAGPSDSTSPTASPAEDHRTYRSRKRRPCDRCRRGKQLCVIAKEGQPCSGCRARSQRCTFDLPPVRRHGPKPSEISAPPEVSQQSSQSTAVASGLNGQSSNPPQAGQSGFTDPLVPSSVIDTTQDPPWMSSFTEGVRASTNPVAVGPTAEPWAVNLPNQDSLPLPEAEIWRLLFAPDEAPPPGPVSLDREYGEGMESHFLGTGTFRGLTLREINDATESVQNRPGKVEFRQVSADKTSPVYFVRHPSLQYGQAPENGKAAWGKVTKICAQLGSGVFIQALQIIRTVFLPALPLFNYPQFEQACIGVQGAGPIPYSLLAAIVAHSASYIPVLHPLHQQLWATVLNAIDAEFREPRLITIQLAMVLLSSRPGVNFAQSDITLARTVGAVHVLGLHIDPSQWALPQWERSLRIRLFWTVLFHDKMRSLLLGRPSNLHESNYSTAMPTVEDARWVEDGDPVILTVNDKASVESFIANCKLVPIIDKILAGFLTVKAALDRTRYLSRLELIEEVRRDLEVLEHGISNLGMTEPMVRATGICSLRLSVVGLKVILHRLELDIVDRLTSPHTLSTIYESALTTATTAVRLVESFTDLDRSLFWMPYTFHHMSNIGSLLLRISAENRMIDPVRCAKAITLASGYCSTLGRYWKEGQWDMANETLKRLAEPAFTIAKEHREARELYLIISRALDYHIADNLWADQSTSITVDTNHFGFYNDGFDPSVWTIDGLQWTDS